MLPDSDDRPAVRNEVSRVAGVPLPVLLDLRTPVRLIGCGEGSMHGTSMPEASVDENRNLLLRKDDVWPDDPRPGNPDRKVNTESKTGAVQRRSHHQLKRSIASLVGTHDAPTRLRNALPAIGGFPSAVAAGTLGIGMAPRVDEQQVTAMIVPSAETARSGSDPDREFLRRRERPIEQADGTQIVDLFSSLGGLTYGALEGLRRAGRTGRLQMAVDNDPAALHVLQETLQGADRRYACADLSRLLAPIASRVRPDERELLRVAKPGALLLAGPPCQGHSTLNNHTRHDDDRNDLYLSVARAARLIEPKAIVIENVRSVGSDRRRTVERCTAALEELGYEVASKRLNLNRIGVPQTRVRHLLVATQDAEFDWDLPETHGRDVRWAIEDLLDLEGTSYIDSPSRPTRANQQRIDWLFDNHAFDLPNPQRPVCHQSQHSYVSMYGRLRWDAPAQTVTGGFGSMGQGRYVHPLRKRTLTPHEAARLQCLPDYVQLACETRRGALAKMIGNAAPPLIAIRLVEALCEQALV